MLSAIVSIINNTHTITLTKMIKYSNIFTCTELSKTAESLLKAGNSTKVKKKERHTTYFNILSCACDQLHIRR